MSNFEDIVNKFMNIGIKNFYIFFITKKEGKFQTFYCNMPDLINDFQEQYNNKITEIVKGKVFEEYNVMGSEADCIEVLSTEKIANLIELKKLLNPQSAKKASDIKVSISEVLGYAVVYINNEDKKLTLIRKFINSKSFNTKRKFTIVSGNLKENKQDLFFIDMNIDAIEIENKTYIVNRFYFEQFFSFNEEYVSFVKKSLESLKKQDVIDNFDNFSNRCLDSGNLVRKLVYVVREDRLHWLKNNIVNAENVAKEYKLKVKIEEGKIKYSKKDCNISDVMKLICGCCVKDAVDMEKYFAAYVKRVKGGS